MSLVAKLKPGAAAMVAATAAVAVAGFLFASGARTEELKHYDSNNKNFWLHPPDDWFMGDETEAQKGTAVANTLPPPTGFTKQEIEATLKNIMLFVSQDCLGDSVGFDYFYPLLQFQFRKVVGGGFHLIVGNTPRSREHIKSPNLDETGPLRTEKKADWLDGEDHA